MTTLHTLYIPHFKFTHFIFHHMTTLHKSTLSERNRIKTMLGWRRVALWHTQKVLLYTHFFGGEGENNYNFSMSLLVISVIQTQISISSPSPRVKRTWQPIRKLCCRDLSGFKYLIPSLCLFSSFEVLFFGSKPFKSNLNIYLRVTTNLIFLMPCQLPIGLKMQRLCRCDLSSTLMQVNTHLCQ